MWVRDANNRSEPIPQQHRSNLFVHTLRTPASRERAAVFTVEPASLLDAGTHRGDYPSSNGAILKLYFAAAASRSATSS